jgi:hypothetical protein
MTLLTHHLGLLILFGLPVLAAITAWIRWPLRSSDIAVRWLPTWALAAVSLLIAISTVLTSDQWHGQARLAWLGVQRSDTHLRMGGSTELTDAGWPVSEEGPLLDILAPIASPGQTRNAMLDVQGSEAFVFVRKPGGELEPVNGRTLNAGETLDMAQYQLRIGELPTAIWKGSLEVCSASGTTLVSVDLPRAGLSEAALLSWVPSAVPGFDHRSRVLHLESLLSEGHPVILPGQESQMPLIRSWAAKIRLYQKGTALRVIGPGLVGDTRKMVMPCEVEVRWATRRVVKFVLQGGAQGTGVQAWFQKPWRHTCELPPLLGKDGDERTDLIVASAALPKENTFLLPLGRGVSAERIPLQLVREGKDVMIAMTDAERRLSEYNQHPPQLDLDWSPHHLRSHKEIKLTDKTGPGEPADLTFQLGVVHDLPKADSLWVAAFLPLLGLLWGLRLSARHLSLSGSSGPAAHGLVWVFWSFLCFRLMLALRGAMSPVYLDAHAVAAVVHAWMGLLLAPGIVLLGLSLTALPKGSRDRRQMRSSVIWYALGLLVMALGQFYLATKVWPDPPSAGKILIFSGLALSTIIVMAVAPPLSGGIMSKLMGWMPRLATRLHTTMQSLQEASALMKMRTVLVVLLVYGFFIMVIAVTPRILAFMGLRDLAGEVVVPMFVLWMPALAWLVAKAYQSRRSNAPVQRGFHRGWLPLVLLAGVFAFCPPIFLAGLGGDSGASLAAFGLMGGVTLILLIGVGEWGHRFTGLVMLATLLAGAAVLTFAFQFFPDKFGEAKVRFDAWTQGVENLELDYMLSDSLPSSDPGMRDSRKVGNVVQHIWEGSAMVHDSGVMGHGWAMAPTRRSQVPQEVLQFDSVFSFFIIGDWGLWGGLLLLAAAAAPLGFVLAGSRGFAGVGQGIALLVAWAFLTEAMLHALMNVNALPFTGRNLPVLAVSSISDLCRWTVMFGLAACALCWHTIPQARTIMERPLWHHQKVDSNAPDEPITAQAAPWRWAMWLMFAAPLGIGLAWVHSSASGLMAEVAYGKSFDWKGTRSIVDGLLARSKLVTAVSAQGEKIHRLEVDTSLSLPLTKLLMQEVFRFNALQEDEKFLDPGINAVIAKLTDARDRRDYDKLIDDFRQESAARQFERPSAFAMVRNPKREDVDESDDLADQVDADVAAQASQIASPVRCVSPDGRFRVIANPAFFSHFQLARESTDHFPEVHWEITPGDPLTVVGPAWVMGRTKLAYRPLQALPWIGPMAEALTQERALATSPFSPTAVKQPIEITLDPALHIAAQSFTAEHGRSLHSEILANIPGSEDDPTVRLPPRLGLCVLDMVNGRTLALGGWPRMHSGPNWIQADGGEWIPPARWLQHEAPRSLELRYNGDRNFDLMLMGSSTKPLWASIALAIHPELDQSLEVCGSGSSSGDPEHEVFGINFSERRPWKGSVNDGFKDFNYYLAHSDNAYHVRLGFLTIANTIGGPVLPGERSPDSKVSMNGGKSSWRHYPVFDPQIAFTPTQTRKMIDLDHTEMALKWREMFDIPVSANDIYARARMSFWSGNATHDMVGAPSTARVAKAIPVDADGQPLGPLPPPVEDYDNAPSSFLGLSPQTPQFRLDELETPRQFVSVLFGGLTNQWPNTDIAAAFANVVTGHPITPHILKSEAESFTHPNPGRHYPDLSARLRQGMSEIFTKPHGTVPLALGNSSTKLTQLRAMFDRLGVKAYGKTGTLPEKAKGRNLSRLLVALVRWDDESIGSVKSGIVLSLFAERADPSGSSGTATRWLTDYLLDQEGALDAALDRHQ